MTSSSPSEYAPSVGRSKTIQKFWVPATGRPVRPGNEEADLGINISVVFTSVDSTLSALRAAGTLASSLGARITLLVPQVVPHPLPLENPPVSAQFNEARFRVIVSRSPVQARVRIYLCRDRTQALKSVLNPGSIVIIGGRKRWCWPTRDERLARWLRRAGHEVIFTEAE